MPDNITNRNISDATRLKVLNEWLKNFSNFQANFTALSTLSGGYSNLTWLLTTDNGIRYVLRQAPPGAATISKGHDMVREFGILQALERAEFRQAPRPVVCCDDASVLGAHFYLMTAVDGPVLRATDTRHWAATLQPDDWRRLSKALAAQLAALHNIDIQSTGLVHIGKPEGYIERQVEGWTKRYHAAQTDDLSEMTQLASWLAGHLPAPVSPTLLHNDFKYDNVVFDTGLQHIEAILDWEMTTVGDPRIDIGTALSYWSEAGDSSFERSFNLSWLPGNLTRSGFLDHYAEQTGHAPADMLFFYVFGLFKNAVVMQQIYSRYKKGLTQDQRFAGLTEGVKMLSRKGCQAIDQNIIV